MARTASQIKMGYYPTPGLEMALIKEKIVCKDDPQTCSVLDMCCGTGEFTEIFPEQITYGVELDYERYQAALKKANRVVWGDAISEFSTTNDAFSSLYLNPPYDWSYSETTSERMEVVFLRRSLKYLKKHGLLVFLLPRPILEKCARLLANHFKNIQVMAFTEKNYDDFKQVVVFGYKEPGIDPETEVLLKEMARAENLTIPRVDQDDSKFVLTRSNPIKTFQTNRIDPELVRSKLKNRFKVSSLFEKESIETINTIMPLRQGHKAMILASGMMNGVYGEGEKRIIVKGSTQKTVSREETEDGYIEKEKIQIIIKAINLHNGEFLDIQ